MSRDDLTYCCIFVLLGILLVSLVYDEHYRPSPLEIGLRATQNLGVE